MVSIRQSAAMQMVGILGILVAGWLLNLPHGGMAANTHHQSAHRTVTLSCSPHADMDNPCSFRGQAATVLEDESDCMQCLHLVEISGLSCIWVRPRRWEPGLSLALA